MIQLEFSDSGDVPELEAELNQILLSQSITAKVKREKNHIFILLESQETPPL